MKAQALTSQGTTMYDGSLREFNAHDRCDSCGAQAYTLAMREDMPTELLFCLHHRKRHVRSLEDEGWTIIDDYEAISRLADNNQLQEPSEL